MYQLQAMESDTRHMQKIGLILTILIAITFTSSVQAASTATITRLEPPVWVLHNDGEKTKLDRESQLKVGDKIVTGKNAQIEFQLQPEILIQVTENSAVTYLGDENVESSVQTDLSILSVQKGMACINSSSAANINDKLVSRIATTLQATFWHPGQVCYIRNGDLSSILLWRGSVQIVHSILDNMIILSEQGSEFLVNDKGEFEMLQFDPDKTTVASIAALLNENFVPEKQTSMPESEAVEQVSGDDSLSSDPPVTAPAKNDSAIEITADEVQSSRILTENEEENSLLIEEILPEGGTKPADSTARVDENTLVVESDPASQADPSKYEYTVYLFSTRSFEIADKTSKKFQKAGYQTQIYEHVTDEVVRYRIALPGFETKLAAQEFSNLIIGKLGVGDTWIGKTPREP